MRAAHTGLVFLRRELTAANQITKIRLSCVFTIVILFKTHTEDRSMAGGGNTTKTYAHISGEHCEGRDVFEGLQIPASR